MNCTCTGNEKTKEFATPALESRQCKPLCGQEALLSQELNPHQRIQCYPISARSKHLCKYEDDQCNANGFMRKRKNHDQPGRYNASLDRDTRNSSKCLVKLGINDHNKKQGFTYSEILRLCTFPTNVRNKRIPGVSIPAQ